ncbi:hypothetical protein BP5796_01224 [Coleophoma crateriformis]|uniref:Uncharacterized protein n=1 Tax=Coleophoma crateriformis TaxID=565419 RepID=A0A3D8SZX1_9HELO|nr:hypothetical protein BP5796_01224 [Coleophoma crateriformis]
MSTPSALALHQPVQYLSVVTKKGNAYYFRRIPINDGNVCSAGMEEFRDQVQKLGLLCGNWKFSQAFLKLVVETVRVSRFGLYDVEAQPPGGCGLQVVIDSRQLSLGLTSGFQEPATLSHSALFTMMVERYITPATNIAARSTTTSPIEALLITHQVKNMGWLVVPLVCLLLSCAAGLVVGLVKQDWDLAIRVGSSLIGLIGLWQGFIFFVARP